MPEEEVPEFLYHYTTIKALPSIFQKGKVVFRFTDYRFLNDAEEGIFLKKFIEKNRAKYCDRLKDSDSKKLFNKLVDLYTGATEFFNMLAFVPYIMSFTECKDSMQFWRQDYAKDKGLCLKLKTSKFKFPIEPGKSSPTSECPTFRQVKYIGANDSIEDAFPELEQNISGYLKSKGGFNFSNLELLKEFPKKMRTFDVKNKVWKSEKEWRLKIVRAIYLMDTTLYDVKSDYKIDELGVPRGTIEIENPIEEIILGPSFTPQYVDSIKMMLSDSGFDDIDVRCGDGVLNA